MTAIGTIRRLRAANEGNALVELALVLPILATLLTGVADFGLMAYDAMALNQAARAGAQYGFTNRTDTSGIQAAVLAASGLSSTKLTVTTSYQCYDGTAVAYPTACASADQDNGQTRVYLKVTVTEPYSLILPWPGVTNPTPLTGTAVVPIKTAG